MEHLVFTLVTFVLFTALVGIISGKIVKNSDDQKTAKGYFLAGNGLGGFFIAGSMLLTNLSAENLVGLSGQSYAANMSGMAWEATAVVGMFSKKGSKLGAICATIFHIAFYACYKFIFPHIDTPFTNAVSGINYMYIYAISFVIMLVIIFVCSKIAPNTKVFDKSASRNDGYDMTAWKHKNAFAIWLVSFLVYEYFIFSPAGIATENKNVVRIAIVTAIFVIETIVLIVKEMNKRKKTA